MARKASGAESLAFFLLGGPIVVLVGIDQKNWTVAIVGAVLTVVFYGLLILFMPPSTCDLCSTSIKRVWYRWTVKGKKRRVCPNCNRKLERRASRDATRHVK